MMNKGVQYHIAYIRALKMYRKLASMFVYTISIFSKSLLNSYHPESTPHRLIMYNKLGNKVETDISVCKISRLTFSMTRSYPYGTGG